MILNEIQKVSADREVPEFSDSDCDENYLYQVEKISLEDTKEKLKWRKSVFEWKQKNSYGIEKLDEVIHIHYKL